MKTRMHAASWPHDSLPWVLIKACTWLDPIFVEALILHCRGAYTVSVNVPAWKEGLAMRDYLILPLIFLISSCVRPLETTNKLKAHDTDDMLKFSACYWYACVTSYAIENSLCECSWASLCLANKQARTVRVGLASPAIAGPVWEFIKHAKSSTVSVENFEG